MAKEHSENEVKVVQLFFEDSIEFFSQKYLQTG